MEEERKNSKKKRKKNEKMRKRKRNRKQTRPHLHTLTHSPILVSILEFEGWILASTLTVITSRGAVRRTTTTDRNAFCFLSKCPSDVFLQPPSG